MGLIKTITGSRKPNIVEPQHDLDDLMFRSPEGFSDSINNSSEDLRTYVPKFLLFNPGFELELEENDGVVMLMGPSGRGKSTFLRALVNSIQAVNPEPVTHTKFNGYFTVPFVLQYAEAFDIYNVPFGVDTRSKEELYSALLKYPDLGSQTMAEAFVEKVQEALPGKSIEDCLQRAVFAYEAGPWLINSGIALGPFNVQYHGEKPDAWYYCKALSPCNEGSAGEKNFAGIEQFFETVQENSVLCLDDPEIGLDSEKKKSFKERISNYNGQIFIATHDRDFLELSQKVIDFNEFGLRKSD